VAWARGIESEADRTGFVADTRLADKTTLGKLLARYVAEVTPTKDQPTAKGRALVRYPDATFAIARSPS
jgi:hypothetical protein